MFGGKGVPSPQRVRGAPLLAGSFPFITRQAEHALPFPLQQRCFSSHLGVGFISPDSPSQITQAQLCVYICFKEKFLEIYLPLS